jgi:hypothetical protein
MKPISKFFLTFVFLNIILFCSFAEANEMKFSLLEETPKLHSKPLLDLGWWWDV